MNQVNSDIWELPFRSIEFITPIKKRPHLHSGLYGIEQGTYQPRFQNSWETDYIHESSSSDVGVIKEAAVTELKAALDTGQDANLSINW
ncbi:hypothetical protein GNI_081370 [Gregarina niphandrodes]|uniref:Uncharacterized protein n=1 Tax=Gregarina niphandrodes TaxID=110365 RepID=A0A023B6C1_GRENI|nr:hypothetical protein GNI_081370 [Gregarina niphandrodes]EZG65927.1 hypothetical protein GNI_081370 [Gregarina niphandrodes]|eukprot:XP_011134021.1 hypothetical protein GNI_081370 [Gregarina niphandrodes]